MILASALHRIDAWGVALTIALLALVIHGEFSPHAFALLFVIAFSYWFGYAVNDYFDAPYDALDDSGQHVNYFVERPISPQVASLLFVAGCSVILAGFALFRSAGLIAFSISLAVIWAYSAPPIRLKARPGLDLIAHGLFVQTFPYLLCMSLLSLTWTTLDTFVVAINLLASISGQLAQQLRDYDVDLRSSPTFATRFGRSRARLSLSLATAALGVVTLSGFGLGIIPYWLIPFAVLFAPIFTFRMMGIGRTPRPLSLAASVLAMAYVAVVTLTGNTH